MLVVNTVLMSISDTVVDRRELSHSAVGFPRPGPPLILGNGSMTVFLLRFKRPLTRSIAVNIRPTVLVGTIVLALSMLCVKLSR